MKGPFIPAGFTWRVIRCEMKFPEIGSQFEIIEVPTQAISLKDTVDTYMFNSQLISKSNGGMLLVAPIECLHNAKISAYIEYDP